MLFNSFEFILVFLPITFIVYFILNKQRLVAAGKVWIVFASLFFYSWWDIKYLPLILISLFVNYAIGSSFKNDPNSPNLKRKVSEKAVLIFGVVINLALLGYFKYADFFIKNTNTLLGTNFDLLHLVLPLAISFFTFQQIAYLVDAYKGEANEYDFMNYSVFVTFFPQLIAGPIVHHKEMMPQFFNLRTKIINPKNLALGLFLFSIGLGKKVIIADTFATWSNAGYAMSNTLSFFDAWLTSLSYTAQLYFDFSGYTDMALGLGYMFNITLPQNFNSPYKASSIQDFWRRWHMTLSRFLRDYIYIPLGGNRCPEAKVNCNLFSTFLIGGLWHGASWTFVAWGALHGLAMCIQRWWKKLGINMHKALACFITFNFINLTWVFFRATSWQNAFNVLNSMFGMNGFTISDKLFHKFHLEWLQNFGVEPGYSAIPKPDIAFLLVTLFIITIIFAPKTDNLHENFKPTKANLIIAISLMIISLSLFSRVSEFLYFNF